MARRSKVGASPMIHAHIPANAHVKGKGRKGRRRGGKRY